MHRRVTVELFRFALVGIAGLAVDLSILQLYLALFGDRPYSGRLVSWSCAVTTTWMLNRNFTFADCAKASAVRQWAHFVWVNSGGAVVNYIVYALLVSATSLGHAHPAIAAAAGALLGMMLNFAGSRALVFKTL
jgi:putative flippase GtrA